MKLTLLKSLFISLILFVSSAIYAQGTLRGVITDSLTEKSLVGANVFLLGTALGSATNIEGEYSIKPIPEGTYTVKVSYLGYKTKIIEVIIQDNKTTQLDESLSLDVIEGEEVIVTGQLAGQMSAINQQRSSNTIINVISEEKIKELPDANAAESIGRLPGVSILRSGGEANKIILRGLDSKFTIVTIDGMKIPPTDATGRGIDLSMISQSALSGIELYKALTSDKDGDALAGSINLVTKTAPEVREIRTDLKGDYNNLMKSFKQYDFSLHYGERFFDNFLGVQLNGNLENRIRSNERINVNYSFDQGFGGDYFINNFLLEFTDEIRKRDGFSLLLDLKTPDDGTIRINNVYGRTKRDYFWSYREYTSNGGGNYDGPAYDYRDREQEIKTFNSSIHGDNNLLGFNLNWGLSFAQSQSDYPYDYETIFVEDNGMNPSSKFKTHPEQLINYAVNNYTNASLDWAYLRSQDNLDKEKTAFLNVAHPYVIGDLFSGELKFGGKYKIKNRSNTRNEKFTPYYLGRWMEYERLPDGTFRKKDFTGTFFEEWWKLGGGAIGLNQFFVNLDKRDVYGSYPLGPLIDRDRLRQWQSINQYGVNSSGSYLPNAQEIWINPLIKYDDYVVTERVSAGYLMNTLNLGQVLTLIAGLRVEKEDNDYLATYMLGSSGGFPVDPGTIRDTTSSSNQSILLPNVNISFRPFEFMTLRVAAYKALARPDFNMRLDRYIAGRPAESTSQPQVYVGNIGLKTAQAWNFEINTSFFGNEIGLISLSAYYKEIQDMFHMLNNFNTAAVRRNGVLQDTLIQFFGINWPAKFSTTPYNLTLPYNSPKPTKVWGFEFEHQINFHFLPGLLKNIVLTYNASIVRSETIIYGSKTISYIDSSGLIPLRKSTNILVERKQKLEGMPEFFGNISLGYDIAGFSARFSLFHKGEHNVSFSASSSSDQVTKPFTRIDIALKQKITDYLSAFININNVTNVEEGSELNRRQYEYILFDQSEKYGLTADFGVSLQL